jgi:hypothetical protein
MASIDADALAELRVPVALRRRAREILAITDQACAACLDDEYAELSRRLVARLARKRPWPLARGEARIWAAGAIYAIGQLNLLFDRSQKPHPERRRAHRAARRRQELDGEQGGADPQDA